MSGKAKKIMLACIVAVMFTASGFIQSSLNSDRDALGLMQYTELKGAPPVLALTTVALGGFRGLISNALWIRANDLQEDGKYFEMVQLADWITKLEPHFTQVWAVQAWNMAYNITVKFKDPRDRWRWLQRGIELLRDEGLRYNPNDLLIYRELAWFFQHKMGQNLDDAHMYYKQQWANEMSRVVGTNAVVNWDALIHPRNPDELLRLQLLTNKYKMDPVFMKDLNEKYGPLEWRLPEASAIYWAAYGLDQARREQQKIKQDDLITLRRVIYQSMQMSFQRGRLVADNADRQFKFAPNLEIIGKVNAAYEQAMDDDPKNRDHIETAHRNFLRDAVWFLYTYNRKGDAQAWFQYLGKHYPNKPLLEGQTNSFPRNLTLDEYALAMIQEEVGDPDQRKITAILEGMEQTALEDLVVGEEDHFTALRDMQNQVYRLYKSKVGDEAITNRLHIEPLSEMHGRVLTNMLTWQLSPTAAGVLATKLGVPMLPRLQFTNAPPPSGNLESPAEPQSSNAPLHSVAPAESPPK